MYVWTLPGEQKVYASFAIWSTEVVRKDDGVSGTIAGRLIARLAIMQWHCMDKDMLLNVLGKAVAASEIGGEQLIVVDAIDDEAQSFYEHDYFFIPGQEP
ncbi:hypothetical protein [Mycobacterium uberis]|uniref:hypothetical protein n=1 Tax=Mycobacterium uberis TaxID=2162698 RepID=UPI001FB255D3|nr:hypothetical protein [Mycobacterium uberis]